MFNVVDLDDSYVIRCGFNPDKVHMLKLEDQELDRVILNMSVEPGYGIAYDYLLLDCKPKEDGSGYEYLVNEGIGSEFDKAIEILRDDNASDSDKEEALSSILDEVDQIEEYGDMLCWHNSDKVPEGAEVVEAVDTWLCDVYNTVSPWRDDDKRNFFSKAANEYLEANMYRRYLAIDSMDTYLNGHRAARSRDLRSCGYIPDNPRATSRMMMSNRDAVYEFAAYVKSGESSIDLDGKYDGLE